MVGAGKKILGSAGCRLFADGIWTMEREDDSLRKMAWIILSRLEESKSRAGVDYEGGKSEILFVATEVGGRS